MAKLAKSLEHISVLLAQTNCGYYILKEILEKVKEEERKSITKKLLRNADSLVFDQNGHTVLKKIVEYMDTKWSKTYGYGYGYGYGYSYNEDEAKKPWYLNLLKIK